MDSMFNQHAKWLKVSRATTVAVQNCLTEFSADLARVASGPQWLHSPGSGFVDHVINKKARHRAGSSYPPDANCLLSVMDHCLRSRHYVNVVTAGKHPLTAMAEHGRRAVPSIAQGAWECGGWARQRAGRRAGRSDGMYAATYPDTRDTRGGLNIT